jgi:hypothetical protein
MQTRHSSDIGIADFPLSDVHGSDYPLFETVAGTVTTVRLPTQEAGSRQEQQGVYFFLRFLPGAVFSKPRRLLRDDDSADDDYVPESTTFA